METDSWSNSCQKQRAWLASIIDQFWTHFHLSQNHQAKDHIETRLFVKWSYLQTEQLDAANLLKLVSGSCLAKNHVRRHRFQWSEWSLTKRLNFVWKQRKNEHFQWPCVKMLIRRELIKRTKLWVSNQLERVLFNWRRVA